MAALLAQRLINEREVHKIANWLIITVSTCEDMPGWTPTASPESRRAGRWRTGTRSAASDFYKGRRAK